MKQANLVSLLWRLGLYPNQGCKRVRLRLPRVCPPPEVVSASLAKPPPTTQTDVVWTGFWSTNGFRALRNPFVPLWFRAGCW